MHLLLIVWGGLIELNFLFVWVQMRFRLLENVIYSELGGDNISSFRGARRVMRPALP